MQITLRLVSWLKFSTFLRKLQGTILNKIYRRTYLMEQLNGAEKEMKPDHLYTYEDQPRGNE